MQQCAISCSSFLYFIEIHSNETTINSTKFFLYIFFVNFRGVWVFAPTLSSACVSGRYHKNRNIVTSKDVNPPCFCGHSNVESTISRYISRAQWSLQWSLRTVAKENEQKDNDVIYSRSYVTQCFPALENDRNVNKRTMILHFLLQKK